MARLNSPHLKSLSLEEFEKYPVWTWDDEHEGYLPISANQPSPEDYEILIIKAQFETNGYNFEGYLVRDISIYAFGVYVEEKLFPMNLKLQALAQENLKEIFNLLKCKPFQFFPIRYRSAVHLKGSPEIKGSLVLSTQE